MISFYLYDLIGLSRGWKYPMNESALVKSLYVLAKGAESWKQAGTAKLVFGWEVEGRVDREGICREVVLNISSF